MKILSAFVVALFLTGCASTITKSKCEDKPDSCKSAVISKKLNQGEIETGVIYAIPWQLLEFSLTRRLVTEEKLKKALDDAKKAEDEAKKVVKNQETKIIPDLELQITNADASGAAKPKLELELEVAKLELLVFKKNLVKAKAAVVLAQKEIDNFKGDHYKDEIQLKSLDPVPDSRYRFVAKVNRGALTSETIEIKTTASGLLSGGSGKSEGQVDEIFVSLVKAISAVAIGPYPSIKFARAISEIDPARCPTKEMTFTQTFDLREPDFLEKFNEGLIKSKLCYTVSMPTDSMHPTDLGRTSPPIEDNKYYEGLVYPRTTAVQFDLFRTDGPEPVWVKSFYPTVIDNRSLGVIPLVKGYFASNDYEFEFENGLLTRYKSVTPNELLEFLGMFPDAAKAIVSIPTEMLQLKVDYSSAEKGYYEAQKAALEARLAFEKAQSQEEMPVGDTE